jgi:hypothetical protein
VDASRGIVFRIWPSIKTRRGKRRVRFIVDWYMYGERIARVKSLFRLSDAERYFYYRQSLLASGLVHVKHGSMRKHGRVYPSLTVVFEPGGTGPARTYYYYLLSVSGLRSRKRIERLAKCIGDIDPIMPLVNTLWVLRGQVGDDSLRRMIQAYCRAR